MIDAKLPCVTWHIVPGQPDLAGDEIHVWRASVVPEPDVLQRLLATLSPDEKSKTARFLLPRDRDRFIAARGILRMLMSAYLGRPPDALQLDFGPHGKPALYIEGGSHRSICFNLSHSHGLAVYAFTRGREVGIDLELIRHDFGGEEVAERFFSAPELAELRALPAELQAEGFFVCWTRKEAYLKARGEGLQIPLDSFSVSLTSQGPQELHGPDHLVWSLRSFRPAEGFVAAIAGQGNDCRLRFMEWMP